MKFPDPALAPPIVILDTNVVLDWLVFHNPECDALRVSIACGRIRWIATAAMREELAQVLSRGRLDTWHPDPPAIWACWRRHCMEAPTPAVGRAVPRLRCTDADDQKFIDLAVACGARWLLSRDRAVLKLARPLQSFGVQATPPGAWTASGATN